MGDTLHKMQVIIEATTEPLKKGMENSRREVKKSVIVVSAGENRPPIFMVFIPLQKQSPAA